MKKNTCALFDMDGVLVDTEPQYDVFYDKVGEKYLGDPHFASKVKGHTLPNLLKKYFSEFTQEERDHITKKALQFESEMEYPLMPRAMELVHEMKAKGIKVGLVTSSGDHKMVNVYKLLKFDTIFDTLVTANRIVNGKPAPDCYLLASKDLGVEPENCVVFEDSFAGMESGRAAGMKVVGLATTNPADSLVGKCDVIITGFENYTVEDFEDL